MEEYPEELRTPPVTLVSLVGCQEVHALISNHLLSTNPPINTLALPDLSKISLFSKKLNADSSTTTSPPSSVPGIIKRHWLLKHRTRLPSLLAALFSAQHVFGDPAQWLQVCSDLDSIKTVIRARNIKLAIVIVQSDAREEISEDRMIALRKRAEVDSKYVLMFNPNDSSELKNYLGRLANTFAELASSYYSEEGKRIRLRIEKKSVSPVELIVRYCFKVAVYAEFRNDWVEALKFYEEAYHTLREIVGVSTRLPAAQRLTEIKIIAEQLHFKISTLLLHSGKVTEAVTWFRQHKNAYRKLIGLPEVIFLHWDWMSRQYLVFGELLETSSKNFQSFSPVLGSSAKPLSDWECYPAYYYQLAAQYLREKRSALELAVSMSEASNEIDCTSESVVPSVYVGQFSRLLEQGDNVDMLPLSDEEYIGYAISEGRRFRDSLEIIALLKKAYESYCNLKIQRTGSYCGFLMAKEYFAEGDISNAMQIFNSIAILYRKEGWITLLWDVLGYLRECSIKNGNVKEFVEYSLELAALPVSFGTVVQGDTGPAGPANLLQRETIQKEVFELANEEGSGFLSNERFNGLKISGDKALHLDIDLVSPLRLVLLASVAFHEQTIKPGSSTLITISLLSKLPLTVEIDQLDIKFNQPDCNFTISNAQKPQSNKLSGDQQRRMELSPSLSLASNKWLRLTYDIKSDQSGKLDCLSVIAKIGSHFTICCMAESPASLDSLALSPSVEGIETLPMKDSILAFSGLKSSQVEEPDPQVDLHLGASGPALVGEIFIVPVTVIAMGHDVYSGELKINLVDVKGGVLYSPRESETSSLEAHHVELLGITGQGENEFQLGSDQIKKIQQSFGLISVPNLKSGDSWMFKLEIKWHRPKPIMLYASLSYTPHSDELNSQKLHIHKNLQIEGNTAVFLNHHYFMPFRRDPLLLSRNKLSVESDQSESLPSSEKTMLIVSAKNCAEVPIRVQSIFIETEDDAFKSIFSCQDGNSELSNSLTLVPGEEFKKVFIVTPNMNISKMKPGNVCLRWRRDLGLEEQSMSTQTIPWAVTKQKLPDIIMEMPPLVVSMECPPYAILGDPFTYHVKILNQTQLLQEIKYSLGDAQNFVLSGSHIDTIFVLPKSEHILSYKLVPLASGSLQLPKISMTSVRYSGALFQPSNSSSSVFVFPCKPQFNACASANKRVELESVKEG